MAKQCQVLTWLDTLKSIALKVSCYQDNEFFADEFFEGIKPMLSVPLTIKDVEVQAEELYEKYKSLLPDEVFDEYAFCDYEVYTDKFYHRLFWNEIPTPSAVRHLLECFEKLLKMPDIDKATHSLSIYDLGNENLYFSSEKELDEFVENYELGPCTAFQEKPYSEELWSI